jgi:hypothetical protein
MAGKIVVDTIDTDNAFITLNVQQSQIATMNVSGIYSNTGVKMIGANGTVSNTAITGLVTASQIANVANTQLTGTITGSQISSNTLSNTVFQTGSVENYMNAQGLSFGMRNRIINGAMVIDQRNAGASVTPTDAQYCVDRWRAVASAASKFTVQQSTTAPDGFTNSLLLTSSSAYTPSTSEAFGILQLIEGFNCADLMFGTATAKTITVSFWVRSSLTGTFGGFLTNASFNRAYPFTYTINSANTFEQKTVTIAGDTTGTWATNSSGCIGVGFSIGAGATISATAGAWGAGTKLGATGQTQLISTNGATFYITGVQLEKGSTATSFDYRPYGTELALCQRYYWQSTSKPNGTQFYEASGAVVSAATARINFYLPTAMRTQPSVAVNPVYNTGSGWQINLTGITNYALSQAPAILTNDGAASGGGNMFSISFTTASTMSSADYGRAVVPYSPTGTATNNFQFSAEL